MTNPRISYVSRPDTTPEGEKSALAAVYMFLLDRHAKKVDGPTTASDDAKENKNVRAESILPK